MPSVSTLDELMQTWSRHWAIENGYPNYFDKLWQAVKTYYSAGKPYPLPPHFLHPSLNFEKILGEMVALSHWMTPAPWGNTLRQAACDGDAPRHLDFPNPERYGPAVDVRDQLSYLTNELAKHMRGLCQELDRDAEPSRKFAELLDGLRGGFDVGIYNLNYDTVALTAWPDAYTGFGPTGSFETMSMHQRQNWGFIYHLHGSVHNSLNRAFGDQIEWRPDLSGQFFEGHYSTDERSDYQSFPTTTLIAGGFKLDQLLVEPFHSYHAALVRHIYEADAILIGGYGFGDVHVNRALHNRVDNSTKTRPPVMILDYANECTEPMASRYDLWAHEVRRTLKTDGHFFRQPAGTPPFKLATEGAFEVAQMHRAALWHGGFTEAVSRLDSILAWLSGEDDKVLIPRTR